MERKIVAIIEVDDEISFSEIDDGPVPYLEKEVEPLEQSGIRLDNCFIADDDEDDPRQAYINYLVELAFNLQGMEFEDISPASFSEWCKNELVGKVSCPLGGDVENRHTDRAFERAERKFCPDCGTELKSTSKESRWIFCPNCGRGEKL